MKRLAVITMVYNESFNLPYWIAYYSSQVDSLSDLYILDHGSDDCSTAFLDKRINLARLSRECFRENFEACRMEYIGGFIKYLLAFYRAVIYVDCDEFVVVDPRVSPSLSDYVERLELGRAYSFIGYNVLHDFEAEASLRPGDLISELRSRLELCPAMFKSSLVTSGACVSWSEGFHFSSFKPNFGNLFLFHTRYADLRAGLNRLKITRSISDQPRLKRASHQQISDVTFKKWLRDMLCQSLDRGGIEIDNPRVRQFLASLPVVFAETGLYEFPLDLKDDRLYELPQRFSGLF